MKSNKLEVPAWHRSSYSTQENCVEVARTAQQAAVRDSKDPGGPTLVFEKRGFALFVEGLRGRD